MKKLLCLLVVLMFLMSGCGGGGSSDGEPGSDFPPLTQSDIDSIKNFPAINSLEAEGVYWEDAPYSFVSKILPSETTEYKLRVAIDYQLNDPYEDAYLVVYDEDRNPVVGINIHPRDFVNISSNLILYGDTGINETYPSLEFTLQKGEIYYLKATTISSSSEAIIGYWTELKNIIDTTGGLSNVIVNSDNIQLTVWDSGNLIDGDQIDVILNGVVVYSNLVLSEEPIDLEINLSSGQNSLTIHADNEGTVPPNTASIIISNVVTGESTQVYSIYQNEDATMTITY